MVDRGRLGGWVPFSVLGVWLAIGCSSSGGNAPAPIASTDSTDSTCPRLEPTDGSACSTKGLTCGYGPYTSSLCTRDGIWRARVFDVAEGGAPAETGPESPFFDCEAAADCPENFCQFQCCTTQPRGGEGQGGCAICCVNKRCDSFDAATCPSSQCALVTDCSGRAVCRERSSYIPECGAVGSVASQVCCAGLAPVCPDVAADSGCVASSAALPICAACGDGTCEFLVENKCNCAEDCGG